MAKFSQKVMGKEVGEAMTYAKPHTMSGGPLKEGRPNMSKLDTLDPSIGALSKSAGNEPIKTDGIKIRGTGAATKGVKARGPMA
jgi:hypothetical protein